MEAGVSGSFALMVADEFAASVLRARRGFVADDESLVVELVAQVMDGRRNYLGQKHTAKFLKAGEILLTRLAERGTWETWERGGRRGLAEQAQAESERILREHHVIPLDAGQERELDTLLVVAEKELVK